MKKLIVTFLLATLVGLSSASNIPYDELRLNYERSFVSEYSEFPNLDNENQEDLTLIISEVSDGYEIKRPGIPDTQNVTVERGTNSNYWLAEHNVSTGEEINISGEAYTITSTSTEIETDAFGSIEVIKAVYESFSSERSLGDEQVSDYSAQYTTYYHPESGLQLKDKTEATQEIPGQNNSVIETVSTQEIAKNGVGNDEDGLTDLEELIEYNTDPLMNDTDEDGLTDDAEVQEHDTDPRKTDTDGDGLTDEEEVDMDTDPTEADTDSDGLNDGREQELGTSPTEEDTDSDGLDDGREVEIGSNPEESDSDQDGIEDGEEVEVGTSPTVSDTDGDFLNDSIDPMPTSPLLPNGLIALILVAAGGLAYRKKSGEKEEG